MRSIKIVVGTKTLPGFYNPAVLYTCRASFSSDDPDARQSVAVRTDPRLVAWVEAIADARINETGDVCVALWPEDVPWVYEDDLEYTPSLKVDWRALLKRWYPHLVVDLECRVTALPNDDRAKQIINLGDQA